MCSWSARAKPLFFKRTVHQILIKSDLKKKKKRKKRKERESENMYLSIEIRCHISSLIANPKSGIPNRTHRTHTESSKMEIDTCWALNNLQLGHHHWLTFVFGQPPFFINLAKGSSNIISGRGLKLPTYLRNVQGTILSKLCVLFFCIHEMAVFLIHNVNSCHGISINWSPLTQLYWETYFMLRIVCVIMKFNSIQRLCLKLFYRGLFTEDDTKWHAFRFSPR